METVLFKPRYSIVHLVLGIVIMGTIVAMAGRNLVADHKQQLQQTVFQSVPSPLPDVQLGETTSLVPDDKAYQKRYEFTTNWFTGNILVWEKLFAPHKGKPDIHYLEIGLYEGRSAIWMLENILTDPSARLTGIDVFDGPVKERYFANIERTGVANKVKTIVAPSQTVLRGLTLESFDIIYVDGSHDKADVLEDAVLCYRLLKEGGILILDDYRLVDLNVPTILPKAGIDPFAQCFDQRMSVIHNGEQVILKKVARAWRWRPTE